MPSLGWSNNTVLKKLGATKLINYCSALGSAQNFSREIHYFKGQTNLATCTASLSFTTDNSPVIFSSPTSITVCNFRLATIEITFFVASSFGWFLR